MKPLLLILALCYFAPLTVCQDEGAPSPSVLEHVVIYSPVPPSPAYRSNDSFDPAGMEHLYLLTNTFLSLIVRDKVLPSSVNSSTVRALLSASPSEAVSFLESHWSDILLQYIGLLSCSLIGIILAVLLPLIGLFFCMCRCCCRRCKAQPSTYYDKRGDGCKRTCLGLVLSVFVIAAMFGIVCAFVTNYYTYNNWSKVGGKLDDSLSDAGDYFEHTGQSVQVLLVKNFEELKVVVNQIVEDSGPILKEKLGTITEAVAIDNINTVVGGLKGVKNNLRAILKETKKLEVQVGAIQEGLAESQNNLGFALAGCQASNACVKFLEEFDLEKDLALAEEFVGVGFKVPQIDSALIDLGDFIDNKLDEKVEVGKQNFDKVEREIEDSLKDLKPQVQRELDQMGNQLADQNNKIQSILSEINFREIRSDVPQIDEHSKQYVEWRYYVGLGMSSAILLILACFILGLFYGMCGRRPGELYGEECCNKGTGANFLVTGVYLTFFFSFFLMILTTIHFIIGAVAEKAVCETLMKPEHSDIFEQLDREVFAPKLKSFFDYVASDDDLINPKKVNTLQLMSGCHSNETIYNILHLEQQFNITELRNWRAHFGFGDYLENLRKQINDGWNFRNLELLTPETRRDLEELSRSSLSDMDFSKFTDILENEITNIDLKTIVRGLQRLKEQIERVPSLRDVSNKLVNEARWLENQDRQLMDMKLTVRQLKENIASLEKNSRFNKKSLRVSILELISQIDRAESLIAREGPRVAENLTERFVDETASLVDEYVERVVGSVEGSLGYCAPLSTSYNSSVVGLCLQVVQPWNGFWASCGWCFLLYLPCLLLSVSLVSLYRKTEPYPGPLLEAEVQPLDTGDRERQEAKKRHRRQPSSHLPDRSHARRALPATPNQQPQEYSHARYRDRHSRQETPRSRDSREGPPRYTSNPSLANGPGGPPSGPGEYERPPPYYFPGQTPK